MNAGNPNPLAELKAALDEVAEGLDELRGALRGTNDLQLTEFFAAVLDTAQIVVSSHRGDPSETVADDLANLYSLVARRDIRRKDPDLGEVRGLSVLRGALGNLLADISEALSLARKFGLRPIDLTQTLPPTAQLERSGNERALAAIARRLDIVLELLDERIKPHARRGPDASNLQIGLVNFYIKSMMVEIAIAKFEATIADIVDLVSLSRAIEVIGRLTSSFVATVRTVAEKFTEGLVKAAQMISRPVKHIVLGLRTIVGAVMAGRKVRIDGPPMTFLMTLQRTDVGHGQTSAGTSRRSPEIFIPLRARDEHPEFWGWPEDFVNDQAWPGPLDANGRGKMDRTNVPFHVNGRPERVTMWYNPDKKDLRLRNAVLRDAGNIDDILRIRKAAPSEGPVYIADVVSKGSSEYQKLLDRCVSAIGGNSRKRYGYY